jgi:hypothetical protein
MQVYQLDGLSFPLWLARRLPRSLFWAGFLFVFVACMRRRGYSEDYAWRIATVLLYLRLRAGRQRSA